jgi:branched-chain amino acid transport system substrate-binding protein
VKFIERKNAMKLSPSLRVAALAVAGATVIALSGCSLGGGSSSGADGDVIKIGYVTPETGSLAAFSESDDFVLEQMRAYFEENGITLGDGTKHDVEIIKKDTQSDSKRAADVASELILEDEVDMILVSSTPETNNPVADQCEANQVVCISTVAPWETWYYGRGGSDEKHFKYTFHFFWGLGDVLPLYDDIWKRGAPGETNLGALFPNDGDGAAWAGAVPPFAEAAGYTVNNPGAFPNGTTDFSAQIASLKQNQDSLLVSIMVPPDFITFWKQAVQQGYQPKVATVAKAIEFPSVVEAMGNLGNNLSTEIWWSPSYPFSSSLTGDSSADFAASYEEASGKQWTMPLGFAESLFEVANAAFAKSQSTDSEDLVEAMSTLNVDTLVGNLDWANGPMPGVATSPVTGGQWRLIGDAKYSIEIVSNVGHPEIPTTSDVQPLDWPKQ